MQLKVNMYFKCRSVTVSSVGVESVHFWEFKSDVSSVSPCNVVM